MTVGGRRGDSKYRSAARHRAAWRRRKPPYNTCGPCADRCQQLLLNSNVDQVVIRDHSELGAKVVTTIGTTDNVLFKPSCESAQGLDADRHVRLLIRFAVEGSLSGAYSHASSERSGCSRSCRGQTLRVDRAKGLRIVRPRRCD
jgi:hypothetical protein